MRIGVVTATSSEMRALAEQLGATQQILGVPGYRIERRCVGGHTVDAVNCGPGEIAAAGAAQGLLTACSSQVLVNMGVCGALSTQVPQGKALLVKSIVHYQYDVSGVDGGAPARHEGFVGAHMAVPKLWLAAAQRALPDAETLSCASGDKFIADYSEKERLLQDYGTEICDMEAAGVMLVASRAGVPALFIKSVSDGASDNGAGYWHGVADASECCARALLRMILALSCSEASGKEGIA